MIKGFIDNFKVAHAVVKQLRNDEWEFKWNRYTGSFLTASRCGCELWVGNIFLAGWFCDSDPRSNLFGYFWRHYVCYVGVIPAKMRAKKLRREKTLKERKEEQKKWVR